MFSTNIKLAFSSLRSAKIRSFLTMFGVVIGVSSVLIAISIGQGVRQQVITQINQLGNDVITIVPGKTFLTDGSGKVTNFNLTAGQGVSTLTNKDVESLSSIKGVASVTPNILITGVASTVENPNYGKATIIATSPNIKNILDKKVEYGEFFGESDAGRKVVVIGSSVASDLFKQRDPIGRVLTIRGEEFIVRGVLETSPESPLNIGYNFNNAIYMPLDTGIKLINGNAQINQINVKLTSQKNSQATSNAIKAALLANHSNQEDFTVVQQGDFLKAMDQVFSLLTTFVAAIAGISLFVGGVGIMNIMLVSVSERTREIGIRKAVGATKRQIVGQFLVEAVVLSVLGGIVGILLSLTAAYFIKLYTPIIPIIDFETIGIAFGVSVVVGVIFGIAPAFKAAGKDPIRSLRQY